MEDYYNKFRISTDLQHYLYTKLVPYLRDNDIQEDWDPSLILLGYLWCAVKGNLKAERIEPDEDTDMVADMVEAWYDADVYWVQEARGKVERE